MGGASRRGSALATLALAASIAGSGGCRRAPQEQVPVPPPPAPDTAITVSPWPGILDSARHALDVGRYTDAERILATFSVEHVGSPEAVESEFWRAVVLADPDNPAVTPRTAQAALESYLTRGREAPFQPAARALLRLTRINDSLRTALAAARTATEARDKAHAEELTRVRDSLTATQAELERIRRRITGRKP